MPETPAFLQERLLEEGEKARLFFAGLSDQDWERKIYMDGSQWTIQQLLAHFVATERAINRLIENILAGGDGAPENFDIDAYNERKVAELKGVHREEMLDQFMNYRRNNASMVAQFDPADLEKVGRHPFLGVTKLTSIIKLLYRHNQIHLRDVRRVQS